MHQQIYKLKIQYDNYYAYIYIYIHSPALQASRRVWSPVFRRWWFFVLLGDPSAENRTPRRLPWSLFSTIGRSMGRFCLICWLPKSDCFFHCWLMICLVVFGNIYDDLVIPFPFAHATFETLNKHYFCNEFLCFDISKNMMFTHDHDFCRYLFWHWLLMSFGIAWASQIRPIFHYKLRKKALQAE